MFRLTAVLAACLALATTSSIACAVEVDIASSQEGATLHPGDSISLTVTVRNDALIPDRIVAKVSLQIGETVLGCQGQGALQADLPPGGTATKTFSLIIPKSLVLTQPTTGTASVQAISRRTGATDNDSLTFIVEP